MKFWQSFSKKAMLRQFLFSLFLFAVMLSLAIVDSNTQVKVKFYDTSVYVKSDKYTMDIPYDMIESAALETLPDPGERVDNSYDNDVLRAGIWNNEVWGEYHIAADLDASNCIAVRLNDGRLFVFSCKNNSKTEKLYSNLLTHIS